MGLKVFSHNVQGLNSPNKRKKAFKQYKRLGADIILMQETHFSTSNHPQYFDKSFNQFHYTTFSNKSRGVAIFIKNSIIFEPQSIYKDEDSRFIILKGSINRRNVTIASLYAPNEAQTTFFTKFFNILEQYISPHLIIGGDFNLSAHPALDRSKVAPSSKAFSKSINRSLSKLQLIDSWRAHNIGVRAYTHYSHPHSCFARLDYIFCTPILLANSSNTDIHPCPWSDHNIVAFETSHIGMTPTPFNWRLNDSLLSNPSTVQQINTHIEEYFRTNTSEEVLLTSVWAAHKAVLRGHLINIAAARNKSKLTEIKCLTKELHDLYNKLNNNITPDLLNLIQIKCKALNTLLSEDTEKSLRFSKAKFLLHGNSSSTMFARKLNHDTKPPHVYKLRNQKGNIVTHPQDVLQIFTSFYKNLLSGPQTHPPPTTLDWLNSLQLPKLSQLQASSLNDPCTDSEILNIIKSLKTSTAPGPDGFTTSYYKKFAPLLTPSLTKMFNYILSGGHFPEDMLLANLSLIPKPQKDHSHPQNFRPISVLNNDLKLFGRLLANRLAAVITSLIHTDQTGFIPGRQIVDNIRLVTNIVQDANLHSRPLYLLSLDIHKAFDSVNWSYLNHLLPKFGISEKFIHGFNALYHFPQTRIRIPGNNSDFFPLSRGTRQGCPLSPLLFALAIEPLAVAIRNNPNIKGYQKVPYHFKLSLYADDALLFLTDPLISIPNLLSDLHSFHKLSGLFINTNKCSILPINSPPNLTSLLKKNFNFLWSSHSFKYLGVNITISHNLLYKSNYLPLFSQINSLLKIWSSYHISFLGRICAFKMTILPKLLYYFRALPINVPKTRLESLQREINRFIWNNKKPRCSYNLMHRPQDRGGLGLPNLWLYFLATRLVQMAQWSSPDTNISWLTFKSTSIHPLNIRGILWSNTKLYHILNKKNTLIAQLILLWNRIKDNFKLYSATPPLASFLGDPRFPLAFPDHTPFHNWTKNNLTTLKSITLNSKFPSFASLQSRFNFPPSEYHQYTLIHEFYSTYYSLSVNPPSTLFEHICISSPRDKGLISLLYNNLNNFLQPEKSGPMIRWEAEIGSSFPMDSWTKMIKNLRKSNCAAAFRESPIKLHIRWYMTPSRIHSFYPSTSPNCFRGCLLEGSYIHIFWGCKFLEPIWDKLINKLENPLKKKISLSPQICLLYATVPDVPSPCNRLIHSLISSIHWMIAFNWKTQNLPWPQVESRMESLRLSERIHHTLSDTMHIYNEKWKFWSLSDLHCS